MYAVRFIRNLGVVLWAAFWLPSVLLAAHRTSTLAGTPPFPPGTPSSPTTLSAARPSLASPYLHVRAEWTQPADTNRQDGGSSSPAPTFPPAPRPRCSDVLPDLRHDAHNPGSWRFLHRTAGQPRAPDASR